MNGQGSPIKSTAPSRRFYLTILNGLVAGLCCAFLCGLAAAQTLPVVTPPPIKVRIQVAWSGPNEQPWQGQISSDGEISRLRVLGLDADQPGAFIQRKHQILISPRFPTRYSGVEFTVTGQPDSALAINLENRRAGSGTRTLRTTLAEIRAQGQVVKLESDWRLQVIQAGGDLLRVDTQRDTLVFSPGETWRLNVIPNGLQAPASGTVKTRLRVRPTDRMRRREMPKFLGQGHDGWELSEKTLKDDQGGLAPWMDIDVPIPDQEGVYDLLVEVQTRSVTLPPRTLATRRVQFVVIDQRQTPVVGGGEPVTLIDFNPAEQKWSDVFAHLPLLPKKSRGPWGNQPPENWSHQGRQWSRIRAQGWVAYPLPVSATGKPHVVEVQLPGGYAQEVAISVMEENVAGSMAPVSIDSGVIVGDPDISLRGVGRLDKPTVHRIVFWPRTERPVVMISNQQAQPVAFGSVRCLCYENGLPSSGRADSAIGTPRRQRIASLDRPTLRRIFFSESAVDPQAGFPYDDWRTFHLAAERLIAYLAFAGYDGVALNVASDGGTLFPSQHLIPTPKYDRGIYASDGQDLRQKDVLEMLLRMFDRERLTLIPCVEFSSPLPALERILAGAANDHLIPQPPARDDEKTTPPSLATASGIELRGLDGQRGSESYTTTRGVLPYYNLLDVRVQQAMQAVVRELAQRYADHSSWGGLGINLTPHDYAHLPDVDWGTDARTLAAFAAAARKNGLDIAEDQVEQTLKQQILQDAVVGPELTYWLQWRSDRITAFYDRLARDWRQYSREPLYVSLVQLAQSKAWQDRLTPTLPRSNTIESALMAMGLNADALGRIEGINLLRPARQGTWQSLHRQAVNLRSRESDIQAYFRHAEGAQFFHESSRFTAPDFATLGPYGKAVAAATQFRQAGGLARQPYAHSLAEHDDALVWEGGRTLTLGQESSLRQYFDVYRQLPRGKFETVELASAGPVVVRKRVESGQTTAYFVNDSPWPVNCAVQWSAPRGAFGRSLGDAGVELKSAAKPSLGHNYVQLAIQPYGLRALQFDRDSVQITQCRTELPTGVGKQIVDQYQAIASRADELDRWQQDQAGSLRWKAPPVGALRDGGFEASDAAGLPTQWQVRTRGQATAEHDQQVRFSGLQALHLQAEPQGAVSVTSQVIPAPESGRLLVRVQLRGLRDGQAQPLVLRLLSSDPKYQPFADLSQRQLADEFGTYLFQFSDLPSTANLRLKLRLELSGPGEVWVDDVQLYDKWFSKEEHLALERMFYLAWDQQSEGQMAECYQTLSGYWPRFLLRHVELPQLAKPATTVRRSATRRPKQKARMVDRVRRYVPWF